MVQNLQDLNTVIIYADNADNAICSSKEITGHRGGGTKIQMPKDRSILGHMLMNLGVGHYV